MESLNKFIYENRCGKYRGNHFKKEQQDKVKYYIGESDLKRIDDYPLKITFLFYENSKKRDLDNISGWAHKCVMDSLKEMGIIQNDGWKEIVGYSDYFYIDKKHPRVEVILETVHKEESEPKQQ